LASWAERRAVLGVGESASKTVPRRRRSKRAPVQGIGDVG
jgi:hypothetical protein